MEITKIYIQLNDNIETETFLGTASITFNDAFCVKEIGIYRNTHTNEIYTKFPVNFKFKTIAYPIKEDFRQYIENEIISKYNYLIGRRDNGR